MTPKNRSHFITHSPILVVALVISLILMISLACETPESETNIATEIAVNMLATQIADKQTQEAMPSDGQEQAPSNPPEQVEPEQAEPAEEDTGVNLQATIDAQNATQMALELQSTANALQLTQAAQGQEQPQQPPADQSEAPPAQPTGNLPDFDTWIKSASILLYEDMAGDFSVYRFIKRSLDGMGLSYVDVGDALGTYKNQLLSGGPGGQGWDLIISGKELRTSVQGEFYVYLNDAINQGSSVIIEEWDMDSIGLGTLSTLLSRCGIQFQADWIDETMNEQLLYAINGTNPIHHFPNEGISLTNPTGYWNWTDLGDLIRLAPGSSAQLLWGARTNVTDSHGTAAVCLDGRLIFQTYSSHSYGQDRIERMWQNYIYNALKARYDYLASQ